MSEYVNFFEDFPQRSIEVLEAFYSHAKDLQNSREVTLTISVAYGALLFPFERLRDDAKTPHPSNDLHNFPEHAENFKALMEKPFFSLFPMLNSEWFCGNGVVDGQIRRSAERHASKIVGKDKTTKNIVKLIRNALAHSNILSQDNPIRNLVFYSEVPNTGNKFSFLRTTPEQFKTFLVEWVKVIRKNRLSQEEYEEVLDEAA